jgi:hypothetical protein
MKIVLMASLSLVCLTTLAQYALDDFRIVDGQLYNIRRSVKWETLASPDGDSWSVLVVRGIISTNLIDCDQQIYTSDRDTGPFLANTIPILLKNYPGEVYVGMTISKCRAMRLKNRSGDRVNTYDFGLLNTPENRKTLQLQPAVTNSVTIPAGNVSTNGKSAP